MGIKLIPELAAILGDEWDDEPEQPKAKKPAAGSKSTKFVLKGAGLPELPSTIKPGKIPAPPTSMGEIFSQEIEGQQKEHSDRQKAGLAKGYGAAVDAATKAAEFAMFDPLMQSAPVAGIPGLSVGAATRALPRAMDVMDVPRAATTKAAFHVADRMDEDSPLDVVAGAAKAGWKATTDLAVDQIPQPSFSEEMEKRGAKMGGAAGFLSDIAMDPTNLIPGEALAKGAMALPLRLAKNAKRIEQVAEAGKVAGKALDIEALLRQADELDAVAETQRLSAIGASTDDVLHSTSRRVDSTPMEDMLIAGGSAGKNIPVARAGDPAFTIKATPKEPIRAIVDDQVKRLPARALARLQGVPDSYPLPKSEALAKTILGNGVPPPVMKAVVEPLTQFMGENPRGVSLFSGGGIAEIGLKDRINFIGAVEVNGDIGAHYRLAHGPHVEIDDVRNVDFTKWQGADYLHASPVRKNFSAAKIAKGEVQLDIETANATARAIDEIGPRVVTVENVPGYLDSDAMKIITDKLEERGYRWDANVYDAADYGVPQHRKRLILRAVRDNLPPVTAPTGRGPGWKEAIAGIPLGDSSLAPWQIERLEKAGIPISDGMKAAATPGRKKAAQSIKLLDDGLSVTNGSGESAASAEAISRLAGMKSRGEQFAVRQGGGTRPLLGADAVDYVPRPGEEFGIVRADGSFDVLQRGERQPRFGGREAGAINPNLLVSAAGGLGGAAVGGAMDDEHPMRGAALGALAGAGLGLAGMSAAGRRAAPQVVEEVVGVAQPKVEGLIKRVPARPEALGVTPSGIRGQVGLTPGTVRRAEEEARTDAFIRRMGITKPEERAMVDQILTDGDRYYEHRRITRPWSQAEDESWKLTWSGVKLPKGSTLNDSQMMSLERKVRGLTEYATDVDLDARKAQSFLNQGRVADAEAIFAQHGVKSQQALDVLANQSMEEAAIGWQSAMGARSEAGRSLNALKKQLAYKQVAGSDDEFIKRAADLGATGAEIRSKLATLTTPEQRYKFLRSMGRPDAHQKFQYYYLTSLLSGPKTHARNLISNTLNILAMDTGYLAGRGLDVATGKLAFQDFKNEAQMMLHGQRVGLVRGWQEAVNVWRDGFSPADAKVFLEKPPEIRLSDIVGKTNWDSERSTRWLNSVSRFLEASDQFSRSVVFSGALHAGVYKEASGLVKAGKLRPSQMQKWIDNAIRDPELIAPKVWDEATNLAKDSVYRQDAGKFLQNVMGMQRAADEFGAKYIGGLVDKLPGKATRLVGHVVTAPLQNIGTVIAPFIKTPAGVFKKQFRAMGGGFLTAGKAADAGREIEAAIQRGEAMLGVAMMAGLGAYAAASGKPVVTGVGPNDPNLKDDPAKNLDAFYGSQRPNSIRLPLTDTWVDYRSLGPMTGPLSIMGNVSDAVRQQGKVNFTAAADALGRQARGMLSNSFLTGVMGLMSAFEDRTGTSANRVIGRTAAGFVPLSGALRTARQAVDPVIRDTKDETVGGAILQNVKNITPGLSTSVPARVDYAGQVLRNPGNGLARAISPVDMASKPPDATRNALAALGPEAYLVKPPKELKDEIGDPMDLSRLQSTELQRTVGVAQYEVAKILLANPEFRNLPAEARAQALREVMSSARDAAKQSYRDRLRSLNTGK